MSLIDQWLENVASQVRIKRIRGVLTDELRDHILLQKADYLDEGMHESEAEKKAIADMGDAMVVGGELDRVHRPKVQWKGLLIALGMLILGILLQNVFLPESESIHSAYGTKRLILTGITAAVIALFALTDYTFWIKMAIPAVGIWFVCWWYRVNIMWDTSYITFGSLYDNLAILYPAIYIAPEYLCLTMPVLTAFVIGCLRGRGWGAMIVSLILPMAAVYMTRLFSDTGYNYNAMLLMSLLGYVTVLLAVCGGFFRVNKRIACIMTIILMIYPAYLFAADFMGIIKNIQPVITEEVWPVLRQARFIGEGAELTWIDEAVYNMIPYSNVLMVLAIHRFGWLPFGGFTVAICVLLIYCHYKFVHMENKMGALMGRTVTIVLSVQTFLYYLCSFTNYVDNLALPLVSFGNTMLVFDGILVGIILSVLRGERLPEPAVVNRVSPSVFR